MRFRFTCAQCGYSVEVSGGRDRGMIAEVQTISCRECRVLRDFVVVEFDHGEGIPPWGPRPLRCSRRAGHQVQPWTAGGPCPKCGAPIPQGEPTAIGD